MMTSLRFHHAAALLLSLFLVGGSRPVEAATYFVAPTGSDDHPGTLTQPWRTVQRAVDAAQPGDTVRVGQGLYEEVVKSARSGTPENRIVLDGQGVARVTRFWLSHAYITLRGFTVSGEANPGSSAIEIVEGAHHLIVAHNVVNTETNLGVRGISMYREVFDRAGDTNGPSHCLIISNEVRHIFASIAITVGGRYNMIRDNLFEDVFTADFVRLFGHTNTIRRNVFQRNLYREGSGFHADFVQTLGENRHGSLGHHIDGNVIRDMEAQVCQLTMRNSFYDNQHGGWTFSNNIFINISNSASIGIPNTKWLNNLFYRVGYTGGGVLGFGYTEGRSNADGAVVMNNVFLDCGLPGRNTSGWYTGSVTNFFADHNFVAKNDYAPVREEDPPSSFRWFEASGINGGNPMFIDEAQYDFRLRHDSPLRGKGKPLSEFHHDHLERPRPADGPWDIGPLQFAGEDVEQPAPGRPRNVSAVP